MSNGTNGEIRIGTSTVKMGLAQMLKGGVIVSSGTMVCVLGMLVYDWALLYRRGCLRSDVRNDEDG